MVRRPQRWPADEPVRERQAGRRVDHRGLQRQVPAEGGEQAGQALGQHRLARARWPEQEEVVATGGRGLDGEAGHDLAPHVGQVRQRRFGPRRPAPAREAATARRGRAPRRARTGSGPTGPPAGRRAPPRLRTPAARPAWTRRARRRAARSPGTLRTEPSSPSSPRKASPCTASAGTASAATRTPTAMARSSPAPLLRTPDGARLTVMRVIGQGSPLDSSAARTRSRASRQASSGRPTTLNAGRPLATWTSTETGRPSAPSNVADGTMASIAASLRWAGTHPRTRWRAGSAVGRGSRRAR